MFETLGQAVFTPTNRRGLALLAAVCTALGGGSVYAASASWNANPTDGNWVTTSSENNWSTSAGTYPGSVTGTTSPDTATFNVASSITAITINSPSLNIGNITFDASASPYTIGTAGGNPLLLTAGDAITYASTFTGTGTTQTISAPLTLEGSYTLNNANVTASNLLSIGGAISGVTGTQTLTLAGANTGSNSISGVIGNGAATSLAVTKTATAATGTWLFNGTAANTYTGLTTVNGGTLLLKDTGGVAIPGNLTIQGGTINIPAIVQLGASNQIATTSSVTVGSSSGVANLNNQLDLNGFSNTIASLNFLANTSSQTIQVTTGAGTLTLNGNITVSAASTNPLTISGHLALTGAAPTISNAGTGTAAATLTISAVVSDTGGGITQTFGGTVVLSGANTYTGPTSLIAGTLSVNSLGVTGETASSLGAEPAANRSIALGSSTGTSTSGVLTYTGGATTTDHNIVIGANSSGTDALNNNGTGTLTWTGSITGGPHSMFLGGTGTGIFSGVIDVTGGGLHKNGTGTWTINNSADNYTVPLYIDQGTLAVSTVNASSTNGPLGNAPATTAVSISTTGGAATLDFTGAGTTNTTNRTVTLAGNATYPSTIQVDASTAVLTLTGATNGSGSLIKAGAGSLVLGTNTYTGNTTVSAGSLTVDQANLAASSFVNVASGATLGLGYTGTDSINTLILNGFTQSPGIYSAANASPYLSGTGSLTVTAPEPASASLLALSALGLLARRRRPRRST